MSGRAAVLEGVRRCLIEALDVIADEVREDARLIDDLGADSLDLLDLLFRLEQEFGIRISPRDIERRTIAKLGEAPLEVGGMYTPEALGLLREVMPEVPAEELAEGLQVAHLPRRFRVATMVNLVLRLMEEQRGQGTPGNG